MLKQLLFFFMHFLSFEIWVKCAYTFYAIILIQKNLLMTWKVLSIHEELCHITAWRNNSNS